MYLVRSFLPSPFLAHRRWIFFFFSQDDLGKRLTLISFAVIGVIAMVGLWQGSSMVSDTGWG